MPSRAYIDPNPPWRLLEDDAFLFWPWEVFDGFWIDLDEDLCILSGEQSEPRESFMATSENLKLVSQGIMQCEVMQVVVNFNLERELL